MTTQLTGKIQENTSVTLPPPTTLEVGTILTLRMRGHSRTGGADYFAPAVVLEQFQPRGEITCLIWDSTSGNAFQHAYPIREVASMDRLVDDGNGGHVQKRIEYEAQSNIGQILFSPRQFENLATDLETLMQFVHRLTARVARLETAIGEPAGTQGPSSTPVATVVPPIDLKGKK